MIDIVFPDKNEDEFIEMAERLGYKALCFVYDRPTKLEVRSDKLELFSAVLCRPNSNRHLDADLVIVKSDESDRAFFESSFADLIFDLELDGKDGMHARDSGLDQVTCKLARDNGKLVAFSFASILNSTGRQRAKLLGRMMQNIRFCRGFKVRTVTASFATSPFGMRSSHDLKAFGISLGMHPLDAKLSLSNAYDKIKHNAKKKSPDYIAEGVEVVE